ncbi:hypothetical protein C0J52_08057 [Blattella germanica]|nr:hypothetical protein C0J52_08057 [Blattella germanica]
MATAGGGGGGDRNVLVTVLWWICLMWGWAHVATQNHQCPAHNEVSPCTCTVKKNGLDLLCEFTDQQHVSRAMSALKGTSEIIFYLKLRHNSLPKLQDFVFLGLDIRHLTIHNSSLALVEESSLSSLGKGLTQLDLSQNVLSTVPSLAFRNLHHLLILNLNHNRIGNIHGNAFEGLDTLEILTLYENKIFSIDKDAFKGLDNRKLKRLNLGGNQLDSVPTEALNTLDMLKKLEIQENTISKITEGDFEERVKERKCYSRKLKRLNLGGNQLDSVPTEALNTLDMLKKLEIQENTISKITEGDFEDNPLVCDCSLRWYRDWLKNLKDKDDDIMMKKRTLCMMMNEHREYSVQNLPLEKMNCVGKNMEQTSINTATTTFSSCRMVMATALATVAAVTVSSNHHCYYVY